MRIYFSPCGIGLGHVGRILPIAKKLQAKNVEMLFSTYQDGICYIENEKLPVVKAPAVEFQVKPDGTIDFKRTAINPGPFFASFTLMRQVRSEVKTIQGFNPDIVVSDSRASSLLAARLLRKPRICILNQFQVIIPRRKRFLRLARCADLITLTLVGKIWAGGNTVLIPDFPPPYTVCTGNLGIPKQYRKNVKLIGPILSTKPGSLQSQEELRKKLKLPEDRQVVFVPISGPEKEKAFLIRVLEKIFLNFPKEYEVVMSLGYPGASGKVLRRNNFTIYDWIPNRFEYLKACDVVVARSGHGTITQAMCYGKPSILVPTPSHTEQISNAKQALDLGVSKIIPQAELSRERLLKIIRQILDSEMPSKLEQMQKDVSKYDGLENAVQTIIEAAEK
jgi:UDP-N-acetylglucosamine--N-acetylmuramyl-(pentapeptide) pyrophosphoryl-undecaprenol N-acetylglucosamine transferase